MDLQGIFSKTRQNSLKLDKNQKTSISYFGAFNSSLKLGNIKPKTAGFLGQNLGASKPRRTEKVHIPNFDLAGGKEANGKNSTDFKETKIGTVTKLSSSEITRISKPNQLLLVSKFSEQEEDNNDKSSASASASGASSANINKNDTEAEATESDGSDLTPSERSFKNKIKTLIKKPQSLQTSFTKEQPKYQLRLDRSVEKQVNKTIQEIEQIKVSRKNKYQEMMDLLRQRNDEIEK